jgi:hypothetical protein
MTFDEWFDSRLPESDFADHMKIIRLSLKEIAKEAWDVSSEQSMWAFQPSA